MDEHPKTPFVKAKDALEELFSDTSIPAVLTLQYLEELRDEVQIKIDALRADLS